LESDRNAWLEVLESHGAKLHALLTRLTLRHDVAEDLLQDLFLKLHRTGTLSRAVDARAYLFRAAIHLAFDWRRKQRTTVSLQSDPPAAISSPLEGLIDAEDFERILEAMRLLPRHSRDVLVLHYLEQQSYVEIASQLGKTEHHVRAVCHKGLKRLAVIVQLPASEPGNSSVL
jgi:RNA polymerase sigma-70 factor (ECF subfamily)